MADNSPMLSQENDITGDEPMLGGDKAIRPEIVELLRSCIYGNSHSDLLLKWQ